MGSVHTLEIKEQQKETSRIIAHGFRKKRFVRDAPGTVLGALKEKMRRYRMMVGWRGSETARTYTFMQGRSPEWKREN